MTTLIISEKKRELIPASEAKTEDIIFSSIDIFQNSFTVNLLFFYKENIDVEILKNSLADVLKDFQVLAGRFVVTEKGLAVRTTNTGVQLIEAECDQSLEVFKPGKINKFELSKFIENIDPTALINSENPVCSLKVTWLQGGGFVLGCNFAHGLLDMDSLVYFVNCWSKQSRGENYAVPQNDRLAIEMFDRKAVAVAGDIPKETNGFIRFNQEEANAFITKSMQTIPGVREQIFEFSKAELANIKAKASESLREGEWVSTHDSVCAHVWKVLSELRFTGSEEKKQSKLLFVSNVKSKMKSSLPDTFFGNKVCHIVVKKDIESVAEESLSTTALAIRKQIQMLTVDDIKSEFEWLFRNYAGGQPGVLIGNLDVFENDFFLSSFLGFPGYEADFGKGAPEWVTVPFMGLPWTIRLMDAKSSQGMEIHIAMPGEYMQKFLSEEWQKKLHVYA